MKLSENDVCRVYDNGGKTADRFTALYPFEDYSHAPDGMYAAVGMDETPFHPQGIGSHCGAMPGSHLGRRVAFEVLPVDCQRLIRQDIGCKPAELVTVTRHFLIAAAWADTEEHEHWRWTAASIRAAIGYCSAAILECGALWRALTADNSEAAANGYGSHPDAGSVAASFGHDLWLTTGGHGVGFWDRRELEYPHGCKDVTCLDRDGTRKPVTHENMGDALSGVVSGHGHTGCIAKLESRYADFGNGWLYFSHSL